MPTFELTHSHTLAALRRHAANLITAGRVLFLFLAAAFAVTDNLALAFLAVPLAVAAILMDWLDGVAARRYGCESKVGGLLDIVGDRIVENVWWVIFAWLRLIPLWVPVVVLSRGFLIDTLRSYALSKGHTAFGKQTMMQSRIGYLLVASRQSRGAYCAAKVVAFGGLFTLNAVQRAFAPGPLVAGLESIALAAAYLTVALCVIRGIPVVTEFKGLLIEQG
jgi:CDP-diacylglycerol--glycerol-3-phosphate 3-phosphatidyltransferase